MESPSKRIKPVDLSADDQLSPDSLEAKMNVYFKNFIRRKFFIIYNIFQTLFINNILERFL